MTTGAEALRLEPAIGSIIGRRDEQQDNARAESLAASAGHGWLLVIADGMGGHAGGREASQLAVDTYCSTFCAESALPVPDRLHEGLQAANRAIAAATREARDLRDMGCTIIAATLIDDWLHWISVGDSLLLAIKDSQVVRLNADHSLAPEIDRAAREGRMSVREAERHPDRNVLLAALNGAPLKLVDEGMRRLSKGTLVLLATDGILSLSSAQIGGTASDGKTAAEVVAHLLSAIEADMPEDQDNTTLVAARVQAQLRPVAPGRWRRIVGIAFLLASFGGAFCVALILRGSIMHDTLFPASERGTRSTSSPARAPATAGPVERTAGRSRPIPRDPAPIARTSPSQAPKKPVRPSEEGPHFSLSAPAANTQTAPRRQR